MATILQQPNEYNFAGNINNIIVSSDIKIVFKLLFGNEVLLESSYYPDLNSRISIDIKKIIQDTLSSISPSPEEIAARDFPTFSFSIDAGELNEFYAFEGGVDSLIYSSWFASNFLTWQPQTSYVTWNQSQYLSYIALYPCNLKIKGYFADATDQTVLFSTLSANKINTVNLQYSTLPQKFAGKQPQYVDVWTENESGDRLSYIQRFVLKNATNDDDYFLFKNSLGGWDSVVFSGILKNESSSTPKTYTQEDVTKEYQVDYIEKFSKNTGYFLSERYKIWVDEFFKTEERYYLAASGSYEKITILSSTLNHQKGNPSSYSFTYSLSRSTKFLNLPRTEVPDAPLEIINPAQELFFLAPRLSDFSDSVLVDEILFPVQSPFISFWQKLSWGAMWNYLYTKLLASPLGLLSHEHSNMSVIAEFSEADGKLKYKGESIAAAAGTGGLTLGTTALSAHRGDHGKAAYDHTKVANIHFSDAPKNGQTYGRNSEEWVTIDVGGGAAVRLSTSNQVFEYDEAGNIVDPMDYAWIYATIFNISGSPIYYQFVQNGVTIANTTGGVISYMPPATYGAPDIIEVYIRIGSASASVVAFDSISMYGIKPGADGADAFTVVLSNPLHAFPADKNGVVTDYAQSGTDIRVWKGISPLPVGTGNMTFGVSASGTNITAGTSGTIATYIKRYYNASNMTAAAASIAFTILARDDNGNEYTFVQQQSFSISKAGKDGEAGGPGPVGPSLVFAGEYDPAATYTGNAKRLDIVKYTANGRYYVALPTAGTFSGKAPIDADYWEVDDGQRRFVATELLFAQSTYVRNLIAEQLKTAESGRRVEINAGDKQQIAIYDAYENLKVLVKPEPISSRSVIESGSATAYNYPTADVSTKNSSWSSPNFGPVEYRQESASFVVSLDGALEIEVGTISLTAGATPGTYASAMATVDVWLEKYASGAWNFVGSIGSCSESDSSKYVSKTIRGLSAGTYRLVASHYHMAWTSWMPGMPVIADSCSAYSKWSYGSGSSFSITVRRVIAQTEIGTDGIASIWASNKYLHFSQNGLYIKMGTKTFEVTETAVKINGTTYS